MIDINECVLNNTLCDYNQLCINTGGSYECICQDGFIKNDTKCVDFDECQYKTLCNYTNQICVNKIGSYHCECANGYELGLNGICLGIEINK